MLQALKTMLQGTYNYVITAISQTTGLAHPSRHTGGIVPDIDLLRFGLQEQMDISLSLYIYIYVATPRSFAWKQL